MADSKSYYVFVGNPGAGKSTILNGIANKVLFKSGIAIGPGCTKVLQVEEVERKGIFMDTPGLSDPKLRVQAAQEISKALKKTGNYRIFFVVTLESGRVRPDDVTTIKLVTDALVDVPGVCYSIILNKLEPVVVEMLNKNEENCVDDLMACLMGDDMKVRTSNIYYMSYVHELTQTRGMDPSKRDELQYELPRGLFEFIMMAPRVFVDASKVHDVKADQFEEMKELFAGQIETLKGNLEEQKAVNARNEQALEEQRKIMGESQEKAAKEREEFIAKLKAMEDKHAKEVANRQDEQQRVVDRMRKDAEERSEADKKEMLEDIKKIQKEHKDEIKDMQDKHQKDREVAEAKSPDGASVIQTILGVIPHVAPALESIAKVIGKVF